MGWTQGGTLTLKDLREAAGLSVQQVAASGISPATYSLLEDGELAGGLPAANLLRLAVIFGVTEAELAAAVDASQADVRTGWIAQPLSGR